MLATWVFTVHSLITSSDAISAFTRLLAAAALGQLVGLLGWIVFLPLVVLGPLVTGAVAAGRGVRFVLTAALWCSAGINRAWTDWLVNREDMAFHLALSTD